jgi:hypothetical protein
VKPCTVLSRVPKHAATICILKGLEAEKEAAKLLMTPMRDATVAGLWKGRISTMNR